MTKLEKLSAKGLHISHHRHVVLLKVVHAESEFERKEAHAQVSKELKRKNIWMAITQNGILLSREWPEAPDKAIVAFPDQGTALQVLEEIGAQSSFNTSAMSYDDAIATANHNKALLVMVTYDDETPHYVPISHLSA